MSARAFSRCPLVVLLACLTMLSSAELAGACSCVPVPTRERLNRANAALIGTVESTYSLGGSGYRERIVYVLRVEQSFKRSLGERLEVEGGGPASGSLCGYTPSIGSRGGLFLYDSSRREGRHVASSCDSVDPAELRRAAREGSQPPPPPPTRGLLVGGRFGPLRLLLLDRNGSTLAQAAGRGRVLALATCPGGRRALELVARGRKTRVVTRRVPDLRALRVRAVARRRGAAHIRCLDRNARRVKVLAGAGPNGGRAKVLGGDTYRLAGRRLLLNGSPLRTFRGRPTRLAGLQPLATSTGLRQARKCAPPPLVRASFP